MKKFLSFILVSIMMLCFVGNVEADEASDIAALLPTEFKFDVKESEALKTYEGTAFRRLLDAKAEEISAGIEKLGLDKSNYTVSLSSDFYSGEGANNDLVDIHKTYVLIKNNTTGVYIVDKSIKTTFSNTKDYNEADAEYVKSKVLPLWFAKINPKDIADNSKNQTREEMFNKILNDDSIKVVVEDRMGVATPLSTSMLVDLYFFKNDVLYGAKATWYTEAISITVPEEVAETTSAYVEYALPIVKEFLKANDPEANPDTIKLKGTILAEREETEPRVEKDYYYPVDKNGEISTIDDSIDPKVASFVYDNNYQSKFFEVVDINDDDCYYGDVIIQKAPKKETVVTEKVTIKGELPTGTSIISETIEDATLEEMSNHLKELGIKEVLSSFELKVNGNLDGNTVDISFDIGKEYENRTVYILHQKHDGTYEDFRRKVENGTVTITVNEFSPFVIALEDRSLDDEPKTGIEENADYSGFIGGVLTAFAGLGLWLLKIKK